MRAAETEAPPYVTVIFAVVDVATGEVLTVKSRLALPCGIVTVFATVAFALSLETSMTTPGLGASPLIVTVAEVAVPPRTVDGVRIKLRSVGGVTVTEAVSVPLSVAVT